MVNLFVNVLALALCCGMIWLAVTFLQHFLGKKYGVFWRFLTCILLALRLLLPFPLGECSVLMKLPSTGTVSDSPQTQTKEPAMSEEDDFLPAMSEGDKLMEEAAHGDRSLAEELEGDKFQAETKEGRDDAGEGMHIGKDRVLSHVLETGMVLWVAGMCLYFIRLALSWVAFRKKLKRWRAVPEPAAMKVFLELCEEMHMKRTICLVQCGTVHSPMLAGLFRTCVILPQDGYQEKEYRLLLQHELCHYVRGDLLWKHLFALVRGIYWFAPWIHCMAGVVNSDMEILCDRDVIRRNGESCKKEYSMILLRHMAMQQAQVSSLTTYFNGGKKYMKERFRELMNRETSKKGVGIILCFALLIGITGGVALGLADSVKKDTADAMAERVTDKEATVVLDKENKGDAKAEENELTLAGQLKDTENYLLVGLEDFSGTSYADMVVLLTIHPDMEEITVLDLPRSLGVRIGSDDKAEYYKLSHLYARDGLKGIENAVESLLSISIKGSVALNFSGFEKMIDAIGGIPVELSKKEADYLNKTNYISKKEYRNLTEGEQLINGNQALGYVRIRRVGSATGKMDELGRGERAKAVLQAGFETVRDKKEAWYGLIKTCLDEVETDLTAAQVFTAAKTIWSGDYSLSYDARGDELSYSQIRGEAGQMFLTEENFGMIELEMK